MNAAGEHRFSGACLPEEEHRRIGGCRLPDLLEHASKRRAVPDNDRRTREPLQLFTQVRVLVSQPISHGRTLDHRAPERLITLPPREHAGEDERDDAKPVDDLRSPLPAVADDAEADSAPGAALDRDRHGNARPGSEPCQAGAVDLVGDLVERLEADKVAGADLRQMPGQLFRRRDTRRRRWPAGPRPLMRVDEVAALVHELEQRASVEVEGPHHATQRFLDRPIDVVGSEIDEFSPEVADERLELSPLIPRRAHASLEAVAIGHIDDRGEDESRLAKGHRRQTDFDRHFGAILAASEHLARCGHDPRFRVSQVIVAEPGMSRPRGVRNQHVNRLAGQLRAGVAEHALDLAVGRQDHAVGIDDQHAGGQPFDCRAKKLRQGIDAERCMPVMIDASCCHAAVLSVRDPRDAYSRRKSGAGDQNRPRPTRDLEAEPERDREVLSVRLLGDAVRAGELRAPHVVPPHLDVEEGRLTEPESDTAAEVDARVPGPRSPMMRSTGTATG